METEKVLVVGGGGRGDVISRKHEESQDTRTVVVAGGDDWTGYKRKKEVIIEPCDIKDAASIIAVVEKHRPHLVDMTQDDALATDAADMLRRKGFRVFGPSRKAARIEWDKKWSRELMARHRIPAPAFRAFQSRGTAEKHVREIYAHNPQVALYIKAAGLAAGKGALKATSLPQALARIKQMKTFGSAGKTFIVEKALSGREFSHTVIVDERGVWHTFKPAEDHKRALPFDEGEQTGGMGVVSPVGIAARCLKEIEGHLVGNLLDGLADEGIPYSGILYVGGMLVRDSEAPAGYMPHCIEYNARWGDPEAQTVLPAVQTDYTKLVTAAAEGRLSDVVLKQDGLYRVCIVGVARGYPGDYNPVIGKRIYGLEETRRELRVDIYGAGIKRVSDKFYANGGRLFSVVAASPSFAHARELAYAAMARIHVEGNNLRYRTDIGWEESEYLLTRA